MTRNQRLLALAGAIVVAIVAVGLVYELKGGSSPSATTTTTASTTALTGSAFLKGVPQHGDTLGDPNAPATLYVFEDPQCPYCQEWSTGALPTVVAKYVKTGKVKLVWRGIAIIGPNSVNGLRAAYSAAQDNKLWNVVDELYKTQGEENSGWITEDEIRAIAPAAGVNAAKVLAGVNSATVSKALLASATLAKQYGVDETPSFVLVKPPGKPVMLNESGLDPTSFDAALTSALQ